MISNRIAIFNFVVAVALLVACVLFASGCAHRAVVQKQFGELPYPPKTIFYRLPIKKVSKGSINYINIAPTITMRQGQNEGPASGKTGMEYMGSSDEFIGQWVQEALRHDLGQFGYDVDTTFNPLNYGCILQPELISMRNGEVVVRYRLIKNGNEIFSKEYRGQGLSGVAAQQVANGYAVGLRRTIIDLLSDMYLY